MNEEQPQGWLTPESSMRRAFLLDDGNEPVEHVAAGRFGRPKRRNYTDTGVITFTLRNVSDALN